METREQLESGIAGAVAGYTEVLHGGRGDHHAVSGAGAWLLCAVAYLGAAAGAELPGSAQLAAEEVSELESVLGMELATLRRVVPALMDSMPEALQVALGCWWREGEMSPGLRVALSAVTSLGEVAAGAMPAQSALDAWAATATDEQITAFPLEVEDETSLVLATALATRITWSAPFAGRFTHAGFGGQVRELMGSGERHRVELWASPAGLLGVHSAGAPGMGVTSVIGVEDEIAPAVLQHLAHQISMRLAAHEIAAPDARREVLGGLEDELHPLSLDEVFALPLGRRGHVTIHEEEFAAFQPGERRVRGEARLPAWQCTTRLEGRELPGVQVAGRLIGTHLRSWMEAGAGEVEAAQSVVARFDRYGFEAAAVTAMGVRAGSAMASPSHRGRERSVEVWFDEAFAAVAHVSEPPRTYGGAPGAWHGVSAFSAWVHAPEAAPAAEVSRRGGLWG